MMINDDELEPFGPIDDMRGAILMVIASSDEPVGQGAIAFELRRKGMETSVPTVGRRLQELEFEGFVEKVGVQGRILTDRGAEAVSQFRAEAMLKASGTALLETLTRGDEEHLLDLLNVRILLEGATAELAAERVSEQTIARLEALLERQATSIRSGELGIAEDVAFHHEIARASGNTVLASLVTHLRQHHRYNLAVTSIRAKVGRRLVVDHGEILDALRDHDPVAARKAMEHHLQTLAEDLKQYWADSTVSDDSAKSVASSGNADPE